MSVQDVQKNGGINNMINIQCTDLGYKYNVMENLQTEERANEFLNEFNNSNSINSINSFKSYDIVETWGNTERRSENNA